MKIDAIARLFASNSLSSQAPSTKKAGTSSEASESASSEAVKVNSAFGREQSDAVRSERQEKIASLKKQVADGTYSPNSRDVAVALARELFA